MNEKAPFRCRVPCIAELSFFDNPLFKRGRLPAVAAGGQFRVGHAGGLADVFQLVLGGEIFPADGTLDHLEDLVPDDPLVVHRLHGDKPRGADEGAGTAADAGVGVEPDARLLQVPVRSPVLEVEGGDTDDLGAGPHAKPAEDAVVLLPFSEKTSTPSFAASSRTASVSGYR